VLPSSVGVKRGSCTEGSLFGSRIASRLTWRRPLSGLLFLGKEAHPTILKAGPLKIESRQRHGYAPGLTAATKKRPAGFLNFWAKGQIASWQAFLFIIRRLPDSGRDAGERTSQGSLPRGFLRIVDHARSTGSEEKTGARTDFTPNEEFERMLSEGLFLEHAEVLKSVGRPQVVDDARLAGHDLLLDIDVRGANAGTRQLPEAGQFLFCPNPKVLRTRLCAIAAARTDCDESELYAAKARRAGRLE